eukprot:scaffold487_cov178-Ochromonas_danica.AAC.13
MRGLALFPSDYCDACSAYNNGFKDRQKRSDYDYCNAWEPATQQKDSASTKAAGTHNGGASATAQHSSRSSSTAEQKTEEHEEGPKVHLH